MLRLSRYHCLLGELRHSAGGGRIRSRELAEELGVAEETVRRDLAYVQVHGRPGSGYDIESLYASIRDFLSLSALHPFVAVGNIDILRGLTVTFPAEEFGLSAAGYFSEREGDVGELVGEKTVHALAEIPKLTARLGVTIALVGTEPSAVQRTLELLAEGGVRGVVMLTPVLRPKHPEGMNITYFRMPCALKSLVSTEFTPAPPTCCHK
jgi:NADH/NAD ratio-sensing transcriptional regulator Rex